MKQGKLEIKLFGVAEVQGEPLGGKTAQLLAYLCLAECMPVAKSTLIDEVWSGTLPQRPDRTLNNVLSKLRRTEFGRVMVDNGREPYVEIDREAIALDTDEALERMQDARRAFDDRDWQPAIDAVGEVLKLARPGILCGEDAAWLESHRSRFERVVNAALELAAEAALKLGHDRLEQAYAFADPVQRRQLESGYRLKMQIAMANGDHAEAARIDADLEQMLRARGLRPSDKTRAVRAELYVDGRAPRWEAERRLDGNARELPRAGPAASGASIDRDRRSEHYCELARHLGPLLGRSNVHAQLAGLAKDIANIAWGISYALERDRSIGFEAVIDLKDLCWYRGLSIELLAELALARSTEHPRHGEVVNTAGLDAIARSDLVTARRLFEYGIAFACEKGDAPTLALCTLGLAETALRLFAFDDALAGFDAGLAICTAGLDNPLERIGCRDLDDPLGRANCLLGRGQVALWRGDRAAVVRDVSRALELYKTVNDLLGIANCVRALAEAAMDRADDERVRAGVRRAYRCYWDIGHLLGQAAALRDLAELMRRAGELAQAKEHLERALAIHAKIGNTLGRANCHMGLGDVARACEDPDEARSQYDQALPLYRSRGCVRGQVEIANRLAALALERSEPDLARVELEAALKLDVSAVDPYSLARTRIYLARLGDGDGASHIAAKADLERAGRSDLADALVPGCEPPTPRMIPDDNA